ncbi:MAG: TMEM165/GDT1 family protein [Bacteroidales bacterium]|jgi:threonine/homoserine/homoserine lactone efflux protein|nr:TMEM165/GDT1 family protein [Bacteroidales bacterium]
MFVVLLQGILLGLVISISAGPSFFALVQIGIQRGFKYGLSMSLGITLSDLTLIIVSYYGLASYINANENAGIIGTIGGIILILYGGYSVITARKKKDKKIIVTEEFETEEGNEYLKPIPKPVSKRKKEQAENNPSVYVKKDKTSKFSKFFGPEAGVLTYFLKGYFINILNPVVLILWAGAVVTVTSMSNENTVRENVFVFFLGSIVMLLIFNILKVLLGKQIKNFLKPKVIEWINIIIGIIFAICGFILIIRVLFFM